MAVQAYGPPPARYPGRQGAGHQQAGRQGGGRPITGRPASARPEPARQQGQNATGLSARGLALWVNPAEGDPVDPEIWDRAARLVLARAMKLAPEAEVRIWPAIGAEHSGVGDTSWGGTPQEAADAGNHLPQSGSMALAEALAAARATAESDGGDHPSEGGSTAVEPVTLAARRSQLAIDLAAEVVLLDGKPVAFTGMEYKLLRYLVVNCSRAIGREELQRFLESFDLPGAAFRSIDVYVGRVRRKLGSARYTVATVRGGGYQFVPGPYATVRGPAEYSI
jgi:two-component system, OmpR family, response regulator